MHAVNRGVSTLPESEHSVSSKKAHERGKAGEFSRDTPIEEIAAYVSKRYRWAFWILSKW